MSNEDPDRYCIDGLMMGDPTVTLQNTNLLFFTPRNRRNDVVMVLLCIIHMRDVPGGSYMNNYVATS
jgi:hypothetical protein